MKTIVVAGGAGFLGSHLCERLLKENNRVVCIDNLCSGSINNISLFLQNNNFIFIKQDIIDGIDIDYNIDGIYNLACRASPPKYQEDPLHTIMTNTRGVINLLELARKNNAVILQASTSEVYGDPLVHPQKEDYRGNVSTTGPRACYDEGKRIAETLLSDYKRIYGVNIRIARIFNTYGPRMDSSDGRVISNFISQALKSEDITVYGDGTQTRSFCFVSDLINGLMLLMKSNISTPVNLGNPEEMTIIDTAKKIINISRSSSKIVFKPLPEDDPKLRRPDITLAKSKLSFMPLVSFDDGIRRTINYFSDIKAS